jgi:hypothetical protein
VRILDPWPEVPARIEALGPAPQGVIATNPTWPSKSRRSARFGNWPWETGRETGWMRYLRSPRCVNSLSVRVTRAGADRRSASLQGRVHGDRGVREPARTSGRVALVLQRTQRERRRRQRIEKPMPRARGRWPSLERASSRHLVFLGGARRGSSRFRRQTHALRPKSVVSGHATSANTNENPPTK